MSTDTLRDHPVLPHADWLAARTALLAKEKEFTRLRDQLTEARRKLPWERVATEYIFEGRRGRQTLGDLFDGRSQLVIYHAMFDPASASADTAWTSNAACD